jgi:hypothetical protein
MRIQLKLGMIGMNLVFASSMLLAAGCERESAQPLSTAADSATKPATAVLTIPRHGLVFEPTRSDITVGQVFSLCMTPIQSRFG